MSDQILEDYKAYYSARAERYANNSNYANTYQAEKKLSDAMQSCNTLDEFRTRIGTLNEDCAIALVKDEQLMEKKHYEKHQEIIRVKASERILGKVESCKTAMDIASMSVEETNKTSMEISMDEAHRQFIYDWDILDEITAYENAVVPDKYKKDMAESVQSMKESLTEGIDSLEKNNTEWQNNWRIIPEKNLEYRHRRLLPFSDDQIREQVNKYKSIINR